MKKQTFTATDFQQKTYAKPQIKVVEIKSAELLSGSGDTEKYEQEEYNPWQ